MSSSKKSKSQQQRPSTSATAAIASRNASKTKRPGDIQRPLQGKVFHLNVKRQQAAKRLKEDLEYLGGTVDPFLHKNVWYLITDNIEAKETKGTGDTGNQSAASPSVSTPSPFHHTKGCDGTADSPSTASAQESGPVTRGQAILQKAFKSQRSQGSGSNVLDNAKKLGIHVYHLDTVAILKYLAREKLKLQQQLGNTEEGAKGQGSATASRSSTSKARRLTRPYLKYEDASRHYRPVSKELSAVPRVLLDTARGSCPFEPHHQRKENREQRAERNCDEAAAGGDAGGVTPSAPKRSKVSQKTPHQSSKATHSTSKKTPHRDTGVKEKRRGYCECCAVKYEDLDKHLVSSQHLEFVTKQNHYVNLDRMIAEGPNIDKFLDDVMKYHESDKIDAQTLHAEIDDVLLISSPYHKSSKPQPAAIDPAAASTSKVPTFALPQTPDKQSKRSPSKAAACNTPLYSPRTNRLSRRQRVSPRLLAGGGLPAADATDTQQSHDRIAGVRRASTTVVGKETDSVVESSILPDGQSRIVPPRPPSEESSLYKATDRPSNALPTRQSRSPRKLSRGKKTDAHATDDDSKPIDQLLEVATDLTTVGRSLRSPPQQSQGNELKEPSVKDNDKLIGVKLEATTVGKPVKSPKRSLRSPQRSFQGKQSKKPVDDVDRKPVSDVLDEDKANGGRSLHSPRRQTRRERSTKDGNEPSEGDKTITNTKEIADADKESDDTASPSKGTRRKTRRSLSPQMAPDARTRHSDVHNNSGLPSSVNVKKRKNSHIPDDILEENDEEDVFEPEVRRFRTPGRKAGNFTGADDSKQFRTPRSCSANSVEQPNSSKVSSLRRPLRSCAEERDKDVEGGTPLLGGRSRRKRKSEAASEDEPKRKLRLREKPANTTEEPLMLSDNKGDSPDSLEDFKTHDKSGSVSRKASTIKAKVNRSASAKQRRLERKQAIVDKLNKKQSTCSNTGNEIAQDIDNVITSSNLLVQDIDKVIDAAKAVTASSSPFKRSTTPVPLHIAALMVPEPLNDPRLPSLFRSESSMGEFDGFPSEDVRATGDNLFNMSADKDNGDIEIQLENAALNVCCVPTSELDVDQKSESSHSSVEIGDISMVFKSLENFPSEGSEWEVNMNQCFENAMEDLKRRTSELQALTPKSHLDKGPEAGSLKENLVKDTNCRTDTADGFAEMPSTAAVHGASSYRRSTRNKKSSDTQDNTLVATDDNTVPCNTHTSGKSAAHMSGVFKAPFPSPSKNLLRMSSPSRSRTLITSTPIRPHGIATEDADGIPCISFPPGTPTEDEPIILEQYVHDVDAEVDFPKFSSPDRGIMGMSPVKHVVLSNGEIGSPRPRRRSNLAMSKDGFSYTISPTASKPPVTLPEARKSLFKRTPSVDTMTSPGSHQQLGSPTSLDYDYASTMMNRSASSTPLSASTLNRSAPIFTFYTGGKGARKRLGSLSMHKRPNFSSGILKPVKKSKLQTKRLSRKKKTKSPRRSVSLTVSQNASADEDVYEFVDEGLGASQSSKDSSPVTGSPKKNLVSVAIQTNEEDLEPRSDLTVRIPSSPVKSPHGRERQRERPRDRPAETLSLACFQPVVNLKAAVLPREFWN